MRAMKVQKLSRMLMASFFIIFVLAHSISVQMKFCRSHYERRNEKAHQAGSK